MQGEASSGRGWRIFARLLLLVPFAALIWVPSYNRIEPELAGIPFFYWYQLAWIIISAGLVLAVYLIDIGAERRR